MSSGIKGSASAVRLSRKQDGQGGALGGWDDRFRPHRAGRATGPPGGIADGVTRGGPSSRPTPPAPERGVPGDGPWPREERPGRGSEWRRRQASRTASAFLGVGGEIHTLMSSPGPRPRGGMMPRNDTWGGRDAHQGLAEGQGPWRVGA